MEAANGKMEGEEYRDAMDDGWAVVGELSLSLSLSLRGAARNRGQGMEARRGRREENLSASEQEGSS